MSDNQETVPIQCPNCGHYKVVGTKGGEGDLFDLLFFFILVGITGGLWIFIQLFINSTRNNVVKNGEKLKCTNCNYQWIYQELN
jgi:DNA-directed RNA polymerase subunit RPC12/RpoP